ncbi:hypothetical protein PDL71_15555 [Lacibacter sp. MH-610]|uniref:hypothetical protein n=1 Tax=Lacibacter sp. MH-610 TaxID=3020883 RepID=UPI00389295A9
MKKETGVEPLTESGNAAQASVGRSAQPLTPQTANTTNKLCKLTRDNMSNGGFWILAQEKTIVISRHQDGSSLEASIEIPKSVFDAFVEFYTKG